MTSSRTGPFSLIRELLKDNSTLKSICYISGILEIILDGYAVVTSQFIEGMKKSGFVLDNIHNSIDPEFLSENSEESLRMENL